MNRHLLSALLTLSVFFVRAQNYRCLQGGVQHYFTNGLGYLRGVAIDSVNSSGGNTNYYPYRSLRTSVGTGFDTASGSWLCKKVIQEADGTFLFGNYRGDTVIIKSAANVGDSWTFYNDTSLNSYTATVTAIDTMTVLGTPDSVKTIVISAYHAGAPNTGDSINNFSIVLSKNNGFVRVFNLFTFPVVFDDYLNAGGGNIFHWSASALFTITDYHAPTMMSMYDFNAGDVFVHTRWVTNPWMITLQNGIYYDSIISRTVPDAYHISYLVFHKENVTNYGVTPPTTITDTVNTIAVNTYTMTVDTTPIARFNQMPETFHIGDLLFYQPDDTSDCYRGAWYSEIPLQMDTSRPTIPTRPEQFKTGFMLLSYVDDSEDWGYHPLYIRYQLVYSVKNTTPCGSVPQLQTKIIAQPRLAIFPNPANDELTIRTDFNFPYTVSLLNIMGQTVIRLSSSKSEETINTAQLPDGLYALSMADEAGNRYFEKVVVRH